jgi:ubiquitin-like protein Pup
MVNSFEGVDMYRKYFPDENSDRPNVRNVQLPRAASEQEQSEKHAEKSQSPQPPKAETAQRKTNVAEKGEKIKKDLDKIIDEIDGVLEENAEEFIRSYVQRGGE